jgi:hypothetical protein
MLSKTLFPLTNNPADAIAFLQQHFLLENGEPIVFEPWQKQHVLTPVFERSKTGCDIFLNGLPKKNGKSTLAACVAVYALLLDDPNPEVFSAAGDKDQAKIVFDFVSKTLKRSKLARYFKFYADTVERADGSGMYKALASDASGSHGLNPSCILWDELWNQPDYSLWEALTHSPTRKNPFHFITTYSGYQARVGNLLWDFYQRGVTGADPHQYTFWRSGPDANLASWISPRYIESQRLRFPDHIFRRLHYNEWSIAADSKAFRIPAECWSGTFQDPFQGATYVCGLDLAKIRDFTACIIIRTDVTPRRVVDILKLPHMDYSSQSDLLAAKINRFETPNKVKVFCDVTGPGQSVVEMLRARGLEITDVTFTNESKAKIVTDLAVAFEQRAIALPKAGRTLDESRAIADLELELFNFEPTVLKSGNLRYAAAGSYHDDLAISLALANTAASQPVRTPWSFVINFGAGAQPLGIAHPTVPFSAGVSRRIEPLADDDCGSERLWERM